MNRRAIVAGAALAASAAGLAAQEPAPATALDAVLGSLALRRHGEAHFVELHFLSIVKKPLESSGTLSYDAPDRLEMRTDLPRPESLVLDGGRLTVERGSHRRTLELGAYPQVQPFVEGLRATLAGNRAALEKAFALRFSGDAAHWTIFLKPSAPEAARAVAEIRIAGARDQVLDVEIRQPDGDRSLMSLQPAGNP